MAKKREAISKKIRFEVFKRDSFTCQYCGESAPQVVLHIDHIQPVSKDGDSDILNLITACFACNLGKSNRLLSDDSAIVKQKIQLDELNERREQLELMLQWRNELKNFDNEVLDVAVEEWESVMIGYSLNDGGCLKIKKLLQTFRLEEVLAAIEDSKIYLKYDEEGNLLQESVDLATNKLGGICRVKKQPEWKKELYYIRGIIRKRINYCNDHLLIKMLEQAHIEEGVSIDDLRSLALSVRNWTALMTALNSGEW